MASSTHEVDTHAATTTVDTHAVDAHAESTHEEAHASPIHVILKGEPVANVWGFPVTNSLLMAWIAIAVLVAFAAFMRKKLSLIPGKLQAGIEWVFEGVLGYMTDILEDQKMARKFFPLIMTIFFYVLTVNWLAFIPGVGSIGFTHDGAFVPLFRAASADLNMTLALAIISFLVIEITGLVKLGFFSYGSKYINFSSPVNFAVGLIELVSNLGRLISFSFRLFGNVFAGEVMLVVVAFFVPFLLPVPMMAFEVFVGFIQAVVFAMLTLFFIKLSIMEPHGSESH